MISALFVDDDPHICQAGREFLAMHGVSVDYVFSGDEALDKLHQKRYDVIISDYMMEGMDGVVLLKSVREKYGDIPFIILTGNGSENVIIDAINSGVDYYVRKGYDIQLLFADLSHKVILAVNQSRTKKALLESEERFRHISGIITDFAYSCLKEPDGIYEIDWVTGPVEIITGYTADEITAMSCWKHIVLEEDIPVFEKNVTGLSPGESTRCELRIRRKDGEIVWLASFAECTADSCSPNIYRVFGACQDITVQKKTDIALIKSENLYRSVVENAYEVIVILHEGIIRYANPRAMELFGYSYDDIINHPFIDFIYEEDRAIVASRYISRMRGEKLPLTYDFRITGKDGVVTWVQLSAVIIPWNNGEATLNFLTDISERKLKEQQLKEQSLFFEEIIESLPNPIFIKDRTGLYTGCNKAFEEYIGYSKDQITGRSVYDIFPGDLADIYFKKDNELFAKPGVQTFEAQIKYIDGSYHDVISNKATIEDIHGNIQGIVGVMVDITDRKRTEDALMQAHRQLNLLSGITRHDILNNVNVLQLYLDLIRKKSDISSIEPEIKGIESATNMIQSQIRFTKVYEDLGTHEPVWQKVKPLLLKKRPPENIEYDLDIDDVEVHADPLFERVFFNLLDNSIRHGQSVTRIHVHACESSGRLCIIWEDNGTGIPDTEKDLIFERGYGKNTGLGLFFIREILSITGISIKESGMETKGSRFEINVPKGAFRYSMYGERR